MKNKNFMLKLQKEHQEGGYALVSESGEIYAFAHDLKKLYGVIDAKKIKDADKVVMYVPPIHIKHVFQISLSIQVF